MGLIIFKDHYDDPDGLDFVIKNVIKKFSGEFGLWKKSGFDYSVKYITSNKEAFLEFVSKLEINWKDFVLIYYSDSWEGWDNVSHSLKMPSTEGLSGNNHIIKTITDGALAIDKLIPISNPTFSDGIKLHAERILTYKNILFKDKKDYELFLNQKALFVSKNQKYITGDDKIVYIKDNKVSILNKESFYKYKNIYISRKNVFTVKEKPIYPKLVSNYKGVKYSSAIRFFSHFKESIYLRSKKTSSRRFIIKSIQEDSELVEIINADNISNHTILGINNIIKNYHIYYTEQ